MINTLPSLPEPTDYGRGLYTADQMREYARTALAQPATSGEPVLFIHPATFAMDNAHVGAWKPGHELPGYIPLYAAPQPAPARVPLTDEQTMATLIARAIEAAHGIAAPGAPDAPQSHPQR